METKESRATISTYIRQSTAKELIARKIIPEETYDSVIRRLLQLK